MESPQLGPRINAFKEEKDSNNMSWGDSSTQEWTETERLSHIFAVTPFMMLNLCDDTEIPIWNWFLRTRYMNSWFSHT